MENLNLIRKVAWNFSEKTDIEFKELLSEAAIAYCEAIDDYDPDRNAKFTTFAWWCMKNHLINFCKKETAYRKKHILGAIGHGPGNCKSRRSKQKRPQWQPIPREERLSHMPKYADNSRLEDKMEEWPKDCKQLAQMAIKMGEKILGETPNFSRNGSTPLQRTKDALRQKGWTHQRIQITIKQMKQTVKSI